MTAENERLASLLVKTITELQTVLKETCTERANNIELQLKEIIKKLYETLVELTF